MTSGGEASATLQWFGSPARAQQKKGQSKFVSSAEEGCRNWKEERSRACLGVYAGFTHKVTLIGVPSSTGCVQTYTLTRNRHKSKIIGRGSCGRLFCRGTRMLWIPGSWVTHLSGLSTYTGVECLRKPLDSVDEVKSRS